MGELTLRFGMSDSMAGWAGLPRWSICASRWWGGTP